MCALGHFVCGKCKARMPVSGNRLNILYAWYENIIQKQVCPTCRGSFIGRAFGFETILRNMKDSRLGAVHKWRLQALPPPYLANNDACRWYSTGGPSKYDCRWKSLILNSISRFLLSKVAFLLISCSSDEQKLKKLLYLVHLYIRCWWQRWCYGGRGSSKKWWL